MFNGAGLFTITTLGIIWAVLGVNVTKRIPYMEHLGRKLDILLLSVT